MNGFFNLDSPIVKFGNLVADIFLLSVLWLVTSIPIFTIGASTTALFYVMTRRISDKENYIIKDFFLSFKREFIKSTIVWVILIFLFSLVIFNIYIVNYFFAYNQILLNIFIVLQFIVFFELLIFMVFVFPLLSRFDFKFKELIKNSFFIANRHFPTAVLCLAIFVFIFIFIYYTLFLPLMFFAMGIYSVLTSYLFMRIFKKYKPQLDNEEIL